MDAIQKVKSISIWVFIVPFFAINACLILTTQLHFLIPDQFRIFSIFPYIDGGVSISRTARYFPAYLIFKPLMFLTSFLLIKYWIYNKEIIQQYKKGHKYIRKIIFFGIGSAIALTLHSIFLGVYFDNDFYKFFRRVIILTFIIFEITAQIYLVLTLYFLKNELSEYINLKILKIKILLVSILVLVAIISIPLLSIGDNKFLKNAIEWDYFVGMISFYMLTFFMWKKIK